MNTVTLQTFTCDYGADVVEFCPLSPNENIFAVGNYQLNSTDNSSSRIGKLYLNKENEEKITVLQANETSGILDLKWCPYKVKDKIILGVATATGKCICYELLDEKLIPIYNYNVSSNIALSVAWSIANCNSNLALSDSLGNVYILDIEMENAVNSFKAHSYEAWTITYDYWNINYIYSGGDDSNFCAFDLRGPHKPLYIKKDHQSGVTNIACSTVRENMLCSGSYDESILLWDTRNMKSCLNSLSLGGGVWKIKWKPHSNDSLAVACIHNGVYIIDVLKNADINITASFTEHKSLAYGVDWSSNKENTLVSCSFYDNLVCLWKYENSKNLL